MKRALLAVCLLVGCSERATPSRGAASQPSPIVAARGKLADAEALPSFGVPVKLSVHHGLPWYEDDFEPARAEAATTGKLLFVDLWAPWCHTCLSMREYVLTADTFADVRGRLVFASLDTERASNAEALAKLPAGAYPTFYLLDAEGQVYGRWVGAASPAQLSAFVRDGLRAYEARRGQALAADDPLARLIEGDRAMASEQYAAARAAYEAALANAPAHWPRRADAWVALVSALRKQGDHGACVDAGLRGIELTGSSPSATDLARLALDCAGGLEQADPRPKKLRQKVVKRLRALCMQGDPTLTPDDRGDACGLLAASEHALGDEQGAKAAHERRLQVLSAAAHGKPDELAKTYDAARAESLLALGRGDEAVALLTARERALGDPVTAHLLARSYRELGRHEEALSAIERAISKVAGPRRDKLVQLEAELLLELGK